MEKTLKSKSVEISEKIGPELKIEELTSRNYEGWDDYVVRSGSSSVYHLSGWKDLIEKTFKHEAVYLYGVSGDRIVGALPLVYFRSKIFGKRFISVPFFNYGGVCGETGEIREALLNYAIGMARERGVRSLELRQEKKEDFPLHSGTSKVSMRLELPGDSDVLWKSFPPKLRSQIRRPAKEGCSVKFGGFDLLEDFYNVFSVNMRDLGTPVYPRSFFSNIIQKFEKKIRICCIYSDNKPVAAGFLIGFKDRIEIPWASSLRKYNRMSPNMLLYWEALKYACENSYPVFDFGRTSVDSGTYRFKKQWGSSPHQLYWYYWNEHGQISAQEDRKSGKYKLASIIWKKMPLWISRKLGPAIIKNLPFA